MAKRIKAAAELARVSYCDRNQHLTVACKIKRDLHCSQDIANRGILIFLFKKSTGKFH
eukprot:c37651_g1_i1 orf=127-300(+)